MKNHCFFIYCLFLLFSFDLNSYVPRSNASGILGWRRDRMHSNVSKHPTKNAPVSSVDNVSASRLDLWEAGIDGVFVMPECWAECAWEPRWFDQLYLRGSVRFGWSSKGLWRQRISPVNATVPLIIGGNIFGVQSCNIEGGLGWLYPITSNFGIGPIVGYSYDYLKTRANRLRVLSGSTTADFADLIPEILKSAYQGPWIGLDIYYEVCDWLFYFGYEYHFVTDWQGALTFPLPVAILNDRRHAHKGSGNQLHLGVEWKTCDRWNVGAGIKYRYFHTNHGSRIPIGGFPEDSEEFDSVNNKWNSYGFYVSLGYHF